VLVFPAPPRTVERLFLELPAAAVGNEGAFKFLIPDGLIRWP
jgi:hypothetical protein